MRHTKNPLPNNFSALVGRRIRWLRELHDLTLADMEKRCGVTGKTIQRYERGGLDVSVNAIEAIASSFGIPPTLLCGPVEDFAEKIRARVALAEAPTAEIPTNRQPV